MALPLGLAENTEIRRVEPSLWQRLRAEWWLAGATSSQDAVLCFGNLPPLFRTHGRIFVLIQNRYLIDDVSLKSFPLKPWLRLLIERWWFFARARNASAFIVQSPSMQKVLELSGLIGDKPIYVLPFVDISQNYQRTLTNFMHAERLQDFIYVASGEPHKNHRLLIAAWCQLAHEGYFPSLWLTLDEKNNAELCAWINQKKTQAGLRIENLGGRSHDEIKHLYTQTKALIYPSTFESFGIPLIEARQAGLAVLASELDFVRDVLDPEEAFDPQSSVSIARAVKRFMGWDEKALPLLDATAFLQTLLNKSE
jgi:glycosyltransferase involved in cell wall biosynthesis